VVESPLFALEIVYGETHWHPSGWGYYEIKEAKIRRGRRMPQAPAGI
jgi:diphthamide synthase (EF-2-diphthine--ammonia ligase)